MQYITWSLFNQFLMTWKMFKCNVNWKSPVQNRIDNIIHNTKKTHVYIVYIIIFVKSIYVCMYVCTNVLEKDWKQLLVPGVWIKSVFFPFFLFMLLYFQELEHLSKNKIKLWESKRQKHLKAWYKWMKWGCHLNSHMSFKDDWVCVLKPSQELF